MAGNPKKIMLKGVGIQKEGIAGGVVTPGDLITVNTSGLVVRHPTAADGGRKAFALENFVNGDGIDDDYAEDDTVQYAVCHSGEEVYARVAANATAITLGAALESAGNGTLRIQSTDAATDNTERNNVFGYALEAVDNSSGGTPTRIRVEVA